MNHPHDVERWTFTEGGRIRYLSDDEYAEDQARRSLRRIGLQYDVAIARAAYNGRKRVGHIRVDAACRGFDPLYYRTAGWVVYRGRRDVQTVLRASILALRRECATTAPVTEMPERQTECTTVPVREVA
jgi:hypothetical protein